MQFETLCSDIRLEYVQFYYIKWYFLILLIYKSVFVEVHIRSCYLK